MVDLAKIRKKAKKALKDVASTPPEPAADAQSLPTPPVSEGLASEDVSPASGVADSPEPQQETATSGRLEKFKAEAGVRRGFEKVTVADDRSVERLELLTFTLAGEQYAVDIERIVEIVTPRPLTRIPNAESSILGIISLRGTIVTMVDVRRRLRHAEASGNNEDARIVVADFGMETVGFLVDRVLRVVKIGAAEVEAHPVVHANELEEAVRGVFRSSGALTILLDLDKLLQSAGGAQAARPA